MTRRTEALALRRQSGQPQSTKSASAAATASNTDSAVYGALAPPNEGPAIDGEESGEDEQQEDDYQAASDAAEEEAESASDFEDIAPAARKAKARVAKPRRRSAKHPPSDGSCPFLSLPHETLVHIFSYLPPKRTVLFKQLCRKTASIASDPYGSLWS